MAIPRFISHDRSAQYTSFDPRWRIKLGLLLSTILLALVSVSLFAAAIPQWNANFFHNKGPLRGDWTDGISIGPLTFIFLSSTLCIIHFLSRRKPMPPKVCVALFAITLLSLGPSLFLAGHGSLFRHWRAPAVRNTSGVLVCNLLNVFSRECEPILYAVGELQIAGIVFGSLVWVSVFLLFLIALHETRTAKTNQSRLPRRLTLTIAGMEKGYRKTRDLEQGNRHHRRGSGCGHRQRGSERYYGRRRGDENSDTAPIYIVQHPQAAYSSRPY
jgi:hypothetical protein